MLAWNGSLGVSPFRGIASPAYCVYQFCGHVQPWFFHYLLRSKLFKAYIKTESTGVVYSRLRLYTDDLFRLRAVVPPLSEQSAIIRFLDHVDELIRRYVNVKERLVGLLEEEKRTVMHRVVTRGLDPYAPLNSSGVQGHGEIPAHWEVRRLKTLCSMQSGVGITAASIESEGKFPVYGGNVLRGFASSYTHEGDFALIGRQGALCGNIHVARGRFWASEHAVVATLHPGYLLEWFGAILDAMNLNQYSIAAAQPGLAGERLLNLWLPVPPAREQRVIATYIRKQTADIATAINRARRQIELLQEYRTRLISDLVTGKLDVRDAVSSLSAETNAMDPHCSVAAPDRGDSV